MMDQLLLQMENNNRAVYDAVAVITDYISMKGDTTKFAEYRSTQFGLDAQIPTRWSVFQKFIKDSYLKLKKVLDF